jgi:hypothetical protein
MTSEPNSRGSSSGAGDQEIDRLFERANPNPDRRDCPSAEVVRSLARKQAPIGDPAYEHLTRCSPCYRDFRELQIAAARRSRRIPYSVAAAAALVVFGLSVAVYLLPDRNSSPPLTQVEPVAPPPIVVVTADLRQSAPTRGVTQDERSRPVQLPRDILSLKLLLPVGSEPGRYAFRIVGGTGQTIASTTADASIVDFVTTLKVQLDLRQVEPASYDMNLQRAGEQWSSFLVIVR